MCNRDNRNEKNANRDERSEKNVKSRREKRESVCLVGYAIYIYIYMHISKRGMRPQSGHRAQHAYYVMRKQWHGVDLAIYGLLWRHLGGIME